MSGFAGSLLLLDGETSEQSQLEGAETGHQCHTDKDDVGCSWESGLGTLWMVLEKPGFFGFAIAGILDQASVIVRVKGDKRVIRSMGRQNDNLFFCVFGSPVPPQYDGGTQLLGFLGDVLGALRIPPVTRQVRNANERGGLLLFDRVLARSTCDCARSFFVNGTGQRAALLRRFLSTPRNLASVLGDVQIVLSRDIDNDPLSLNCTKQFTIQKATVERDRK